MPSNAFLIDNLFKKYLRRIAYIKWEDDQMLRRHQQRVRTIRPAIDNKSPDLAPFMALNKKRAQLEEDRLHEIETKNLALLKRLRAIANRRPATFCHRRRKALIRGDAYRLEKPSGKRIWRHDWQALQGSTMRQSLRCQEEALEGLVSQQKVGNKDAKWLQKRMPRVKDIPVHVLNYSKYADKIGSDREPSPEEKEAECSLEHDFHEIVGRTAKLSLGTQSCDMKTKPSDVDSDGLQASSSVNNRTELQDQEYKSL